MMFFPDRTNGREQCRQNITMAFRICMAFRRTRRALADGRQQHNRWIVRFGLQSGGLIRQSPDGTRSRTPSATTTSSFRRKHHVWRRGTRRSVGHPCKTSRSREIIFGSGLLEGSDSLLRGDALDVKNLLELKECRQVLIDNNILEDNWATPRRLRSRHHSTN